VALAGVAAWLLGRLQLPQPGGHVLAVALLTVLGCMTFDQSRMFTDIKTLYETSIEQNPHCWLMQNNLGKLLSDQGNPQKAIDYFEDALKSKHDYIEAYCNLGNALATLGRVDEAIPRYQEALKLNPKNRDAHYNLAVTLAKEGQYRDALDHYEKALNIDPEYSDALNNLAWMRATHPRSEFRDGAEAVNLAERARDLTDDDDPRILLVLDTLAAAYAEADRFPDAVKTESKAIDLAEKHQFPAMAKHLKTRLELYQAGTPYRQELPNAPRRPAVRPTAKRSPTSP
jgi:protein O-mannosyl-transferase